MAVRVTANHAEKAAATRPPIIDTMYTWPCLLLTLMAVLSIKAEKGMRGIHEMNAIIVKLDIRLAPFVPVRPPTLPNLHAEDEKDDSRRPVFLVEIENGSA